MPETTPLIKAALNLRVGAGFDVYFSPPSLTQNKKACTLCMCRLTGQTSDFTHIVNKVLCNQNTSIKICVKLRNNNLRT